MVPCRIFFRSYEHAKQGLARASASQACFSCSWLAKKPGQGSLQPQHQHSQHRLVTIMRAYCTDATVTCLVANMQPQHNSQLACCPIMPPNMHTFYQPCLNAITSFSFFFFHACAHAIMANTAQTRSLKLDVPKRAVLGYHLRQFGCCPPAGCQS